MIFKNSKGFSLIEIMVAVGLVGIVSMAIMQMLENMNKSVKHTETKMDLDVKQKNIEALLINESSCTKTFTSPSVSLLGIGSVKILPNNFSFKSAAGSALYSVGATVTGSRIKLNNVKLKNIDVNTTNLGGMMEVQIEYGERKVGSTKTFLSKSMVEVEVDASLKILKCNLSATSFTNTASQKACESIGGTYVVATNTCTLDPDPTNAVPKPDTASAASGNWVNSLFVHKAGDIMTGNLAITAGGLTVTGSTNITGTLSTTSDIKTNTKLCIQNGAVIKCLNDPANICASGTALAGYNSNGSANCVQALPNCANGKFLLKISGSWQCSTFPGNTACGANTYVSGVDVAGNVTCANIPTLTNCSAGKLATISGGQVTCSSTPSCSAGKALTALNGVFSCIPLLTITAKTCATGDYINKVNADGTFVCAAGATPAPPATGGGTLYLGQHIESQCTSAAGAVVGTGSNKFCRFNLPVCPVGWAKYSNWSSTVVKSATSITANIYCGASPANWNKGCSTGSHGWSNVARESCQYCGARAVAWDIYTASVATIYAQIISMGCY